MSNKAIIMQMLVVCIVMSVVSAIGGFQVAMENIKESTVRVIIKNPAEGNMQMVYRSDFDNREWIVHETPAEISWKLDNRGQRTMYGEKRSCSPMSGAHYEF